MVMSRDCNFENFYFLPNSIRNFRKVTKFGGNWLKNTKVTGKKQNWRRKTPSPSPYRVKPLSGLFYTFYIVKLHTHKVMTFPKI